MKYIHLTIKNAFVVFVMLLGVSSTASAWGWWWGHHHYNNCYTGSVYGQVLEDTNKNSRYDCWTDKGLCGVKIKLTDCNGKVSYATTNQSGYYTVKNIRTGSAKVEVVQSSLPAGVRRVYGTEPTWVTVYRGCKAWAGRDGYVVIPKATSVCGTVYEDTNGNGIKDSNEHGQANIQVKICYTKTISHGSHHHGSHHHGCNISWRCHINGFHVAHWIGFGHWCNGCSSHGSHGGGSQTSKVCVTLKTDNQGKYCTTKVPAGQATVTVIESTLPAGAKLTAGKNPNTITVKAHKDNAAGTDGYQNIKLAGITNATAKEGWTSTVLGGVLIMANGYDDPQFWALSSGVPAVGTKMADLSNWPASTEAYSVRAFRSFLISLNIKKSSVPYARVIKYKSAMVKLLPAAPGT